MQDTAPQPSSENGALSFPLTAVQSGTALSPSEDNDGITVNQPGMYMASFQSTVVPQIGATLPLVSDVRLQLNGTSVPGSIANHVFIQSGENANVALTIPVSVSDVPATIQAVTGQTGSNYYNTVLTLHKVGTAST